MRKTTLQDVAPALKDLHFSRFKGQPIEGSLYKVTYRGNSYYRFKAGVYDPYNWDLTLQEIKEPK